jgi:hypothetical protein
MKSKRTRRRIHREGKEAIYDVLMFAFGALAVALSLWIPYAFSVLP